MLSGNAFSQRRDVWRGGLPGNEGLGVVRIASRAKSLLMHSRASTPTSFFGQQKTFPCTPSGGGLPLYRTTRTTVFQSAVKQLKKKYSQKVREQRPRRRISRSYSRHRAPSRFQLQQTFRSSLVWIVVLLLGLVLLLRYTGWFARRT